MVSAGMLADADGVMLGVAVLLEFPHADKDNAVAIVSAPMRAPFALIIKFP
jgi:hypothetical protein